MGLTKDLGALPRVITVSGSNVGIGTTSITSGANQTVTEVYAPMYSTLRLSATGTVKGELTANNQSNWFFCGTTTNHPLILGTNDTERIRVTSSGNVGVGTSIPSVQFNVGHQFHGVGIAYLGASSLPSTAGIFTDSGVNGGQGFGSLQIKSRTDFAGYSINLFTASTANAPQERVRIDSSGMSRFIMGDDPATGGTVTAKFLGYPLNPYGLTFRIYSSGVYSIQSQRESSNSELFPISINPLGGNVLIGTTTDSGGRLQVSGDINVVHGGGYQTRIQSNNQINSYLNGGGSPMYLNFAGNGPIYAGSSYAVLYAGSDRRIKSDIKNVESTLEKVLNLTPRTFRYKERPNDVSYGFIAQEVEEVMPEIVKTSEGISNCAGEEIVNQKSIDSYGLVWASILVKAIQELTERIKILENK